MKCDRCGAEHDARTPFGEQCPHCLFDLGMDEIDASREQVGAYKLLEELGRGGMGIVYLAQQEEPIRRQVALKIIKAGMDTAQVISRFESERQALAVMNHPNVAKVFEAGVTAEGRPFFVMELVAGDPINFHCDRRGMALGDRLRLFIQVCEAIQHAHQNGIIHRDIKPSNVLVGEVDGQPQVKIIDFGVAKATTPALREETHFTQVGALIGTPEYMSPEQADPAGSSVDTRTDVYSLGVLLYELITGALPFEFSDIRGSGYESFLRRIREDDPPRPSRRLSSTERRLDPDLDWIVMKALEKDRARRYGSPSELAADVRRHLDDLPVLASPPDAVYRAKKFVKRYAWGVGAATSVVLVLIAFAATMTVQAKRIAAERDVAEQAQANLELVVDFQAEMLSETSPEEMGRRLLENFSSRIAEAQRERGSSETQVASTLAALEAMVLGVNATDLALGLVDEDILGRAVETLEEKFGDQPLIDARLRATIGTTYRKLGRYERAEPQLEAAFEIRERELGSDHPDTLKSVNDLATLYRRQGRYDEAEPLYLQTLKTRKRVLGEEHPSTLDSMNNLANLYWYQGRYDEAESLYLETLEISKRVLGEEHSDTLASMSNLAGSYLILGRYDEAEPLGLQTLEIQTRVLGEEHPDTLRTMLNLAEAYGGQGRYDKADEVGLRTLAIQQRVLGEEHPETLFSINNLAESYLLQGRYDEAVALFAQAVAGAREAWPPTHWITGAILGGYGKTLTALGRYEEAEAVLLEAHELVLAGLGPGHEQTISVTTSVSELYAVWNEAEPRLTGVPTEARPPR